MELNQGDRDGRREGVSTQHVHLCSLTTSWRCTSSLCLSPLIPLLSRRNSTATYLLCWRTFTSVPPHKMNDMQYKWGRVIMLSSGHYGGISHCFMAYLVEWGTAGDKFNFNFNKIFNLESNAIWGSLICVPLRLSLLRWTILEWEAAMIPFTECVIYIWESINLPLMKKTSTRSLSCGMGSQLVVFCCGE